MRHLAPSLALAMLVALPATVGAKRPEPISCPLDVAAALAMACPCEGGAVGNGALMPWKNHGKYVSCVVRFRNSLRKAGCLSQDEKRTIARCAARSTCGKADTALCCTVEVGVCMGDLVPGDLQATGACSNDATLACDLDADCTRVTSAVLTKDPAACEASGGLVGQGSVCTGCVLP